MDEPFEVHHESEISIELIEGAIYKTIGTMYSAQDISTFLNSFSTSKDNSERFISWMVSFGLLSEQQKWGASLFYLYKKYQDAIADEFSKFGFDHPLKAIPEKKSVEISGDVSRTIHWFQSMAAQLNFNENLLCDAKLHASRILCMLILRIKTFSYCQGYDRYIFMTYLLCLDFSRNGSLPNSFAEAMSYYLSMRFINLADISRFLQHPDSMILYFSLMDEHVKVLCPEIFRLLAQNNQSSFHYALRWKILFFADEYDVNGLFFLWDQILYHKREIKQFLFALCLGHIQQVPILQGDKTMIETIQTYRDWDPVEAVNFAVSYLIRKNTISYREQFKKYTFWTLFALLILCLLHILLC